MPHIPTPLPAHYGILEYQDRYYPTYVSTHSGYLSCFVEHWEDLLIPPALGSRHTGLISFSSRTKAARCVQEMANEYDQTSAWEDLANGVEAFPERNSWFREEILRLAHRADSSLFHGVRFDIKAHFHRVRLNLMLTVEGNYQLLTTSALSLDEALPQLYEKLVQALPSHVSEAADPTPERSSWYREAIIQQLSTGTHAFYNEQDLSLQPIPGGVRAAVMLRHAGRKSTLVGAGATCEKALAALYTHVSMALASDAELALSPE